MIHVPHELIRASAGTGKTYQLTNRYLRLLFLTEAPERIVALTFTRKAAAEFFEKIFHRLACAAGDEKAAAALGKDIGLPADTARCLALLRMLLDGMHRLHLSTYDSFFARIVRSFPFELGLGAPPTMLGDQQRAEAILRVQRSLLQIEEHEEGAMLEFWHAFKRATMGREEKRMSELVDDYILEHQSLFFDAPEAARWGDPRLIWPQGCPWTFDKVDLAEIVRGFRRALPWGTLTDAQRSDWELFLADLDRWEPPAQMPPSVRKFAVKFLGAIDALKTGSATIPGRKKQVFGPVECQLALSLARYCMATELQPRLEATQGIFQLVRLFEAIYRDEVRGMGQLTIEDMTRLLSGDANAGRGMADPEFRLQLDYRLDSCFDHWLLDEFQDTSHTQWRAIASLIDEVLQDSEGRRSFFAVGDTKQCLYMWRGSDDKLFDRIHDRYAAAISVRKLDRSYRSAKPVLDMVNGVFGSTIVVESIAGPALAERWGKMWTEHHTAETLRELNGHACWLLVDKEDEGRKQALADLLETLTPLRRGLSVAILTQTNAEAEGIVDFLRANTEIPCSLAAEVRPGSDNPASAGLRSFLSLAAHPSDKLAWTHLLMTPLAGDLRKRFASPEALSLYLRREIAAKGMAGAVQAWNALAAPHLVPEDLFSRERLSQCCDAARDFDERGLLDIDALLRELDSLTVRETDVPGQVAVMTVHKSKGLDWDVVILPDLEGNSLTEKRRGMAVKRAADGSVEWLLQMPRKDFAGADSVLAEQLTCAEEDAAFEQLCLLYVAMTRAKRGLYVLTHPCGNSKSRNFPKLLETALTPASHQIEIGGKSFPCAWEAGDRNWIETVESAPYSPEKDEEPVLVRESSRRREPALRSTTPSSDGIASSDKDHPSHTPACLPLWPTGDARAVEFGIVVHRALSRISWLRGNPAEDNAIIDAACEGLGESARAAVRRTVLLGAVLPLFLKPARSSELLLEAPFEVVDGGEWISGQADRVILERDNTGAAVGASIVDFKTGSVRDPSFFSAQLLLYRRAIARLYSIPAERISCHVVFVSDKNPGVSRIRGLFD
ncbi:MAG: UvrD-helicase domain-containing protein [Opitutaceae bacterium]|jgi:ATP-dependent exoDNAse (exonuclease V) beta subunit